MIGARAVIRSHTVIYDGNIIGDDFHTGHGALIREDNHIGNMVSIGSHSVIEHHVQIGDRVRIHANTFIPERSVLEPECWIGPCVTFTNARYPNAPNTKDKLEGVSSSARLKLAQAQSCCQGGYASAAAPWLAPARSSRAMCRRSLS